MAGLDLPRFGITQNPSASTPRAGLNSAWIHADHIIFARVW